MQRAAHGAEILRTGVFPALMASALGLNQFFDAAVYKVYLVQMLGDAGNPSDPVTTHPWPPNGGTNVPQRFTDFESPDPHALVPGELGYLLSVNLDGPWHGNFGAKVTVNHASLKTDAGTPVTVTKVDDTTKGGAPGGADIGPYMNDAFAIFPHGALKPQTTYIAHADGVHLVPRHIVVDADRQPNPNAQWCRFSPRESVGVADWFFSLFFVFLMTSLTTLNL